MNCTRCKHELTDDGMCPNCSTFCLWPRSETAPNARVVTPRGAEFSGEILTLMALSRASKILESKYSNVKLEISRGYDGIVASLTYRPTGAYGSLYYSAEGATVAEAATNLEQELGRAV